MRARKSTVGLLFWVALANAASSITDEIAARRTVARNSYYNPEDEKPIHPGCGPNDKRTNFRRPRDESGAGEPCQGQGVVVRRDMGSLGVSSFQQVAGAILADAIGPLFLYYDEWPEAAKLLRESAMHDDYTAHQLIDQQRTNNEVLTLRPDLQEELEMAPWNMTDAVASNFVRQLRKSVCGMSREEDEYRKVASPDISLVRVQGNFQHVAYFHRYRSFIRHCVLKSALEFERMYEPQMAKTEALSRLAHPPLLLTGKDPKHAVGKELPPDLLVYLRLGDKSASGDTHLTFQSGYYDAVLSAVRSQHQRCWIVTSSPGDHRATSLSSKHACRIQASNHYSDWALMYLTRGTLVMAASTYVYFQALVGSATELHYPAVGFFHDKHNVCMRRKKENSHFGQMRLPFGQSGFEGKTVFYHDIYSKQWFLTYDELAAETKALECPAILNQHVCEDNSRPDNWREARYCYRRGNKATEAAAIVAGNEAVEQGESVVRSSSSRATNQ